MAAQYGTAQFLAVQGRGGIQKTYTRDLYFDDTAGNPVRWDSGAGATATSETSWTPSEPILLLDVCLAAATGQTKTQVNRDNQPTGNILRNSLHLASVVVRPQLRIPYGAGQRIAMVQLA